MSNQICCVEQCQRPATATLGDSSFCEKHWNEFLTNGGTNEYIFHGTAKPDRSPSGYYASIMAEDNARISAMMNHQAKYIKGVIKSQDLEERMWSALDRYCVKREAETKPRKTP